MEGGRSMPGVLVAILGQADLEVHLHPPLQAPLSFCVPHRKALEKHSLHFLFVASPRTEQSSYSLLLELDH